MIRQDHPDIIYKSQEAKLRGIAREILTLFARQQPVLVGTRSVEMSERVSDRLRYDRLQLLALTDLLRDKLENTKGLDKAKYAEWSAILNQRLSPYGIAERRGCSGSDARQADRNRPAFPDADQHGRPGQPRRPGETAGNRARKTGNVWTKP